MSQIFDIGPRFCNVENKVWINHPNLPVFLNKIKTKTYITNLRHGSLHMIVICRHVKS